MKFCFIILHYLIGALDDTIECVDSILNNNDHKFLRIIIVDNGSKDESNILLHNKYQNNKMIDIIKLDENLGFAKGNNFGAKLAIDKYNPDFLVVINNDTIIKQPEFLNLIESEYNETKFDVLGPYIYDRNLKPQNPLQIDPIRSIDDIDLKILKRKRHREKLQSHTLYTKLKDNIGRFIKAIKKTLKKFKVIRSFLKNRRLKMYLYNPNIARDNIPLHGSALIFSKNYFLNQTYIFYPETFLYVEEEILYYICKRENYKMRYQPKIKIHHKEDISSDLLFHNNREKLIFIYEQEIRSYNAFKELVIKDQKKQ